jgi:hypothetical protein
MTDESLMVELAPETQPEETPPAIPNMASLFTKMAAVMGALTPVTKSSKHQQGYKYATYSDIVTDIRVAMSQNNLVLIPIMKAIEKTPIPGKNNGERIKGYFDFVLACGDTGVMFTTQWQAEVDSYGDKGINAVATVAEKYFLMRTFLVTSIDDVDETDGTETTPAQKKKTAQPVKKSTEPETEKLHIGKLIEMVTPLYDHQKHAANSVNKMVTDGIIKPDMSVFDAIKTVILHRAASDYQMTEAQVLEAIRATNEDDSITDYAAFLKAGHKHSDVWTAVKEYHTLKNSKPAAPKSEAEQFAEDYNLPIDDAPPVRQNDDDDGIPF